MRRYTTEPLIELHWRIQGGARHAPPRVHFFIFIQLLGKIYQSNRLVPPPLGLAPPLGNPGSATEMNRNGFMSTGENCLVGDQVIAGYGLDIILPHGNCDKICRCPGEDTYEEKKENTQAKCTPLC